MLRLGTRLGLAAHGRKLIGGVLNRGLAAPALVHAAFVTVPWISTALDRPHSIPGCSAIDLRAALGLAVGIGVLVAQPDAAECAPVKRKKKAPAAPPPKRRPGPQLDTIAAALEGNVEKTYDVEAIVADRLVAGKKQYHVKWVGYAAKHNTWEPLENLPNVVTEIGEYHKAKDQANAAHLEKLQKDKDEREAARIAAGNAVNTGDGSSDAALDAADTSDAVKSGSKKTSRAYEAFELDPNDSDGKHYFCQSKENTPGGCVCGDRIAAYTQSLWTHLQGKHKRTWQELKGLLDLGAPIDGGVVASIGELAKQKTLVAAKLMEPRKKECDRACARWIVKSARPITLPERDQPFRDFINVLTTGAWDPPNNANVSREILSMSAEGQLRVKEWMSNLMIDRIKPSMAGDIWSDRGCSLMGINLYGISKSWVMDEWLGAATPFGSTRHTGDAIDTLTVDALKRTGISWSSQGAVYEGIHGKVSDNASNMAKGWSGFAGGFCNAHTIELSVHKYTEHPLIKPSYTRMRGIVGYFNKSTNGIQDLTIIQKELKLPERRPIQDVITRWRSGHDMASWFREQQQAVMTFDIRHAAEAGDVYGANRMELSDWSLVEQSVAVLATSANITTHLEGTKYVTISSVLPMVYRLLAELEDTRSLYLPWKPQAQQWLAPGNMRPAVKTARAAFHDDLYDRYVTSLSEVRKGELVISTILDPRFKDYSLIGTNAADRAWAMDLIENEFDSDWAPSEPAPATAPASSSGAGASSAPLSKKAAKVNESSAMSIFDRPMAPEDVDLAEAPEVAAVDMKSDLEKYKLLAQEPMNTNVLDWWKARDHNKPADPSTGRAEGLPHLARMARQWLGCPATSAGVERLFSKAGSMHHDLKGSMEDGSLEHALIATANTE